MATRSTIAVVHEDGTVSQIYCHWDGYLSHNGKLLDTYYNSRLAVEFLVSKGDLSSLGERVTAKGNHSFDNPEDGVCVYYGRDRGETGVETKTFADVSDFLENMQEEEYDYIFDGETWQVKFDDKNFMPLKDALIQDEMETE